MAESNIREKWGFQHMMEFDEMTRKYEGLKQKTRGSISDVEDQMYYFDKYMKKVDGWEQDQLLYGIYCNLYDHT
jgi:hypothetical protein